MAPFLSGCLPTLTFALQRLFLQPEHDPAGPSEVFRIVGILGFGEADTLGGATLAAFESETE